MDRLLSKLKNAARALKKETYALYLAAGDPRVPWYAKVLVGIIVAYALSPIDLIPDFIPVLGYLDDLILVPLGIKWALTMIPAEVMQECRAKAEEGRAPQSAGAAAVVICIWLACLLWAGSVIYGLVQVSQPTETRKHKYSAIFSRTTPDSGHHM